MNPKAKIVCIDFKSSEGISAIQLLRITQAAIGVNLGTIPSQSATPGLNIYQLGKKEIREYISKVITDNCVNQMIELVPAKYVKDKESVIARITSNALILKNNNYPIQSAPSRDYMPQTDEAPEALDDMNGEVPLV